ncbi:Hypothetical_protein [Hexamita inflata]|uniref:Hypothetical_protein n=1 Tax=Hexamita inflata TaxID=28002 RepID=A0AA86PU29_9EUKA|nr:Hypothetical protein HINF_LOCUS33980 [Hexamita inflata]
MDLALLVVLVRDDQQRRDLGESGGSKESLRLVEDDVETQERPDRSLVSSAKVSRREHAQIVVARVLRSGSGKDGNGLKRNIVGQIEVVHHRLLAEGKVVNPVVKHDSAVWHQVVGENLLDDFHLSQYIEVVI